jgi:hypothetical protein
MLKNLKNYKNTEPYSQQWGFRQSRTGACAKGKGMKELEDKTSATMPWFT